MAITLVKTGPVFWTAFLRFTPFWSRKMDQLGRGDYLIWLASVTVKILLQFTAIYAR